MPWPDGPIQPITGQELASEWRAWCGDCPWTDLMHQFGELGGTSVWWCGYPRSRSAIPLTFTLIGPDGQKMPCDYRLKDIRAAVEQLLAA